MWPLTLVIWSTLWQLSMFHSEAPGVDYLDKYLNLEYAFIQKYGTGNSVFTAINMKSY